MSWVEKKRVRGKVFKFGNPLAFRIPAGTILSAGVEMELTIEHGQHLTLESAEQPKRRLNIAEVVSSAQHSSVIRDQERLIEGRAIVTHQEVVLMDIPGLRIRNWMQ